jgi:histidyl-tRNA synthetase
MAVPQIPKGFRDFLPQKMTVRKRIISLMTEVFESFGFEPLDTPCLEYAETLEGKYGEEGEKLIYKFEDRGGRNVALRYDLTIPLCRVVSAYPDLIKPFKRYQIAPVWRADKPQKGRFREFYQCDIDIIGTESVYADGELLAITDTVLRRLGFDNFVIRINNRKVMNAFALCCGLQAEEVTPFLRSLDKLDKIGADGVLKDLSSSGILNSKLEKSLTGFIINDSEVSDPLSEMASIVAQTEAGKGGMAELEIIRDSLSAYGVPEDNYMFDFSLARGLDYYTGPVFETIVKEPKIGSITGGGRYDNLIGLFSKNTIPATGSSFGLERLVTVMEEKESEKNVSGNTQVLITCFDDALMKENMRVATTLRSSGIKTEIYYKKTKLKKQLTYAANRLIDFVIIMGPDEIKEKKVTLRNMTTSTQETVLQKDMVNKIKSSLSER